MRYITGHNAVRFEECCEKGEIKFLGDRISAFMKK